ncbi:O-antigen ligase family protein [Nostocaceae cyanobacterium CENA369]|uniref:O-antigen ligase family protein n=1 Tax=Dendronalium phyllosphericum CENA369 TaxID=1725256 RepID=A0A8J7HYU0_9NOST|nr:O-antigen ligase family protein [Dendronalium phyllosphericum]MBH8571660.1 O-antigen ligase family protein [Dendronalium phyllosphericum CENA369]
MIFNSKINNKTDSYQSISLLERFNQCLKLAPFAILSLVVYMSLRSTQIFPDEGLIFVNKLWHEAFLGWYDFLLICSIGICFFSGLIKLEKNDFLFILILTFIISLSFLNALDLGEQYIIDALVYLFRFIIVFYLAKGLVYRLGIQTSESVLIFLFIILVLSSIFVARQQLGELNRIYAAGMTVASSSQVASIVCLIALMRKYKLIIFISLTYLFLTFSRTSILVSLILFLIYSRQLSTANKIKYYIAIGILVSIFVVILLTYGGDLYASLIANRTNLDEISTLNSRELIWNNALKLLQSERIPIFGVGFNATPSLIKSANILFVDSYGQLQLPEHFHNIWIEYGFGLGILSLFIFYYLLKRVWQTFQSNCYPSFFIFAFFLICQSADFTFYQPKSVIIWSLMLGLAEGQWRFKYE